MRRRVQDPNPQGRGPYMENIDQKKYEITPILQNQDDLPFSTDRTGMRRAKWETQLGGFTFTRHPLSIRRVISSARENRFLATATVQAAPVA